MNDREREWRFEHLLRLGCVACVFRYDAGLPIPTSPVEIHHLNVGGRAGQRRRGDAFTIPLCAYHHRSEQMSGYTATEMHTYYGPSLARQSKEFRATYGRDDELLRLVDGRLRRLRHSVHQEVPNA